MKPLRHFGGKSSPLGHGYSLAIVWLPMVDEKFYLTVLVDCHTTPTVSWVDVWAGNYVYLDVISEDYSLEDLTDLFAGVELSKTWQKGELKRTTKNGQDIYWESSGFEIRPEPNPTGEVEDKVQAIVEILKSHKEGMVELAQRAEIILRIAYYGYVGGMYGMFFEPKAMRELGELGVPVDIDLYAGGSDDYGPGQEDAP